MFQNKFVFMVEKVTGIFLKQTFKCPHVSLMTIH